MKFDVTVTQARQAQTPHNLFISGLFLFNLLMAPALIGLKVGMIGLFIPLLCSGALIACIYARSRRTTSWFVDAHWKLCFARARLLMLGYAITAALIFVAWLASFAMSDARMGHILWTALTRIALMPTLIAVMIVAVLEFGAAAQAARRELPDKLATQFPPPAGVSVISPQ